MTSNLVGHQPSPSNPQPASAGHGQALSILQFLSGLLAILVCGGISLLFLFMGFSEGLPTGLAALTIAGAAFWVGVLMLPTTGLALLRLIGAPLKSEFLARRGLHLLGLAIFLFPIALFLGNWASQQEGFASLAFPILHVLATTLPVGWIVYLVVRGLTIGSPQRAWGVFGAGLVLGPAIILTLETIALVAAFVVTGIFLFSQPDLIKELSSLAGLFEGDPNNLPDPEVILEMLGPYLTQPVTILGALAFTSVLVPLIEEAFKPIGVWFLAGRRMTPAAGFAAGALSGAGFALFENLLLSANVEAWATLQVARLGTAIIHILATGLMGYALAIAWQQRRYGRLFGFYLIAVLLHGAWNALSMLMTFGDIQRSLDTTLEPGWLTRMGDLAPYAMGGLAVGSLAVLIWMNARLRAPAHEGIE